MDDGDKDAEWQDFIAIADEMIRIANDAVEIEPMEKVAAAFLYACTRYNAFAMQSQGQTPAEVDQENVDYLTEDFTSKLREHMEDTVTQDLGDGEPGLDPESPMATTLAGLGGLDDEAHSEFLDLADKFIDCANGYIRTERASRISAAFSYGCARFVTCLMQMNGLPPDRADEDAVARLGTAYQQLLRQHMAELLVAPNA